MSEIRTNAGAAACATGGVHPRFKGVTAMGWENRNGRQVYYRKKRIGKRVVSEYVGSGEVVTMLAALDERERKQAKRQRREWRKVMEGEAGVDALMRDAGRIVKALTDATFAVNGYRRHKGQWRKCRSKQV